MQIVLYYLTTLAVLAVLIVLILGLYTMLRHKSPNLAQKMMRWRVGLQFFAVIVIMGCIYVAR